VLWVLGAYTHGFAVSGKIAAVIAIAVVGIVMVAVYSGMLRVLRAEEFGAAWGVVRGRINRFTRR
jgi:putative peptidoglycan lipid II flippase